MRAVALSTARAGVAAFLAARPADRARRELALYEPASARLAELRGCAASRARARDSMQQRSRSSSLAGAPRRIALPREAQAATLVLVNGYPLLPLAAARTAGLEIRTLSVLGRENPGPSGAPSRAAVRCRGAALAAAQHRARRRRRCISDRGRRSQRRCSSCTSAPPSARDRRLSAGHHRGRARRQRRPSSSITSSTVPKRP